MNTDQLILALTAPEPTQAEAVAILRKTLPLAQHELTDDEDAEPQVHRIICALLHRDVQRFDVKRALGAISARRDIELGINVEKYTDEPLTPGFRDGMMEGFDRILTAAIGDMTFDIPKKPRTP